MLGHRIVMASVIASMISFHAIAQTTDTGPVVFPNVTNTSISDCWAGGSRSGPGGKVIFLRGGFVLRNGAVYFGTDPNQGNGCIPEINVLFAPAATDVTFTLTAFGPLVLTVYDSSNSVAYTLPALGTVAIKIPGPTTGILIDGNSGTIPFGINGLVITQHPANQGFVQFDLSSSTPSGSDQTKILMSKAAWDVGYPSTAQLAPDAQGNPRVRVAGTLRDKFTGEAKSGPVYLLLTDPRDTAPYRGTDAHDGDNNGTPATLSSTNVQADAQGRFEATLTIHSRTAGDNYQVVGSDNPNFNCGGLCPRSAVITLWKRTYVEDVSMFNSGAFITDAADAGTTTFGVTDPLPFQNLTPGAPLKLIHADAGFGEGFYWEIVYFRGMQRDATGRWNITVDADPNLTGQPLTRDYGTAVGGAHAASYLPWAPLLRDAVGIIGDGTYSASTAFVDSTLGDAYVEMHQLPVIIDEVPHLDNVPGLPDNIQYSDHWFEHSQATTHTANPNVLHRVAANQSPLFRIAAQQGTPAGWGFDVGATIVGGGHNVSFIFDQRIMDLSVGPVVGPRGILLGAQYQNTNSAVVNARTTAHETVHFWVRQQRPGITDAQGHCQAVQYDDSSLTCLMHEAAGANGLDSAHIHMHYLVRPGGVADSEYLIIRSAADPVPQN